MIRKRVEFDDEDLRVAHVVQQKYGCGGFSQAVRLAVRLAAANQRVASPIQLSPKSSNVRHTRTSVRGIIKLPDTMTADRLDALLTEVANSTRFNWRDIDADR